MRKRHSHSQKETPEKETPKLPPEHPVTRPDTVPEKEKVQPVIPVPEISPAPKPEISPGKQLL